MQPADIAITLRRRAPWEAMDLGFTMLGRWWRPVFTAHALVFVPALAAALALGWAYDAMWLGILLVWWLEPLYDRVCLHVLSRAVFGEVASAGFLKRPREYWSGLAWALTFDRFDLARSFNLPVRQLEGSRGRDARERRALLGRRMRSYAVWLTVVWVHFEWVMLWSAGALGSLLLPAQAERARDPSRSFWEGLGQFLQSAAWDDVILYAAVIFALEPFFVAAGFALYLNRRTLLEGWDIEVALRRIAEKHAAVVVAVFCAFALLGSATGYCQERDPKKEIEQILASKEFGYWQDGERWQRKDRGDDEAKRKPLDPGDLRGWLAFTQNLARVGEVLAWLVAAGLLAYALWWAARMLPRYRHAAAEPYRPPAALFGMQVAPETLPADVGAAAAALAHAGKLREALGLLYRGALSELIHKKGVQLLASHTEGDVLRLSGSGYLKDLIEAWRACAYAQRVPPLAEVDRLATGYQAAFA